MELLDKIIEKIGKYSSWLNIFLVILIGFDVLLRYLFSTTENWVLELEWHIYAMIFLFGSSYALQKDEHVRVDLFYQNYSEVRKAWVNLLGHLIFLIPWGIIVIKTSYTFAMNSYSFNESSPNPGGLPFRFIIKFCIVIGFLLLLIQAISQIINYIKIILKNKKSWS